MMTHSNTLARHQADPSMQQCAVSSWHTVRFGGSMEYGYTGWTSDAIAPPGSGARRRSRDFEREIKLSSRCRSCSVKRGMVLSLAGRIGRSEILRRVDRSTEGPAAAIDLVQLPSGCRPNQNRVGTRKDQVAHAAADRAVLRFAVCSRWMLRCAISPT